MTRLSVLPRSMIFATTGSAAGRAGVFWGVAATDSTTATARTARRARFFMGLPPGEMSGGMIVLPLRACQGKRREAGGPRSERLLKKVYSPYISVMSFRSPAASPSEREPTVGPRRFLLI